MNLSMQGVLCLTLPTLLLSGCPGEVVLPVRGGQPVELTIQTRDASHSYHADVTPLGGQPVSCEVGAAAPPCRLAVRSGTNEFALQGARSFVQTLVVPPAPNAVAVIKPSNRAQLFGGIALSSLGIIGASIGVGLMLHYSNQYAETLSDESNANFNRSLIATGVLVGVSLIGIIVSTTTKKSRVELVPVPSRSRREESEVR